MAFYSKKLAKHQSLTGHHIVFFLERLSEQNFLLLHYFRSRENLQSVTSPGWVLGSVVPVGVGVGIVAVVAVIFLQMVASVVGHSLLVGGWSWRVCIVTYTRCSSATVLSGISVSTLTSLY